MKYKIGGILALMLANLLWVPAGDSAIYYVKDSGNDTASGLSDTAAWKTISKVKHFQFSDGDTVCFKRGSTFGDDWLGIQPVSNFTIRDYGEGKKPHINGDKVLPIQILAVKPMSNLIIMNIDISGQDWQPRKSSNLIVKGVRGLTIDGIFGDGHFNGNQSEGKTAISIEECAGPIVIRNCELYNWGPSTIPTPGRDYMGIALVRIAEGVYEIYDNLIHNVNADCLHLYLSTAKGFIHHNRFYNGGENSIDIKSTSNTEIYENTFYRTKDFIGSGGSGEGGVSFLMVIHRADEGDIARNNIIRNNRFLGGDSIGIRTGLVSDTEISYNFFERIAGAISIGNPSVNSLVHHNTLVNIDSAILSEKDLDSGGIYENNSGLGTRIYNNTIFNEVGTCKHLVAIEASAGSKIYNNVVYQGLQGGNSHTLNYPSPGSGANVYDNCWFKTDGRSIVKFQRRIYSMWDIAAWKKVGPGDLFTDPIFKDASGGDLSLSPSSPCQTNGEHWGAN